jgi:threonine dehydrogenase-like Zn-dependent dehydrogenase
MVSLSFVKMFFRWGLNSYYTYEEFRQVVELLSNAKIDIEPIISQIIPLENGVEVFKRLANGPDNLIKVILTL